MKSRLSLLLVVILVLAVGLSPAGRDPAAAAVPVAQTVDDAAADTAPQCPDVTPSYVSPCGPLFTTPQWSDSGGWDDPSSYETIQLADIDGEPGDELIGRSSVGIWVEKFVNGQWRMLGTADGGVALPLSDDRGRNAPQHYSTIQAGDVNGDGAEELLARAGDGLHVYRWDGPSATFIDIAKPPLIFSDAAGWKAKSQYSTIQTADIYGHDGRVEVVGRAADGVHIAVWNEEASRFDDPGPVQHRRWCQQRRGG